MRERISIAAVSVAAFVCAACPAVAPAGAALADRQLAGQVEEAMAKAAGFWRSIATNGGWCGIYTLDLKGRWGEATYEKVPPGHIWVQRPGTPTVGQSFLRAFRVTGRKDYLAAAREAALALAWGQSAAGGWGHVVRVDRAGDDPTTVTRQGGRCYFDDNISQGAVTFLMELDREIDEAWLTESVQLALRHIISAQQDNGGWPQIWPLVGGYHDYCTFNDNAINDCIRVMLHAHRQYGRADCLRAARRGGDFILAAAVSKAQPGWAQQYDRSMKPAWARRFEPPGVCSAVTARNIRTLVDLYLHTGAKKYLAAVPAAIEWLKRSRLGPDRWARLYEIGTNRPIYGDRDGKVHYKLDEISAERRTGYAWEGGFGVSSAIKAYEQALKAGPQAGGPRRPAPAARVSDARVRAALRSLDEKGRWVRGEKVYAADFVRNFNRLIDYAEARRRGGR